MARSDGMVAACYPTVVAKPRSLPKQEAAWFSAGIQVVPVDAADEKIQMACANSWDKLGPFTNPHAAVSLYLSQRKGQAFYSA